MGKPNDPMAVLDERLRVRRRVSGVSGVSGDAGSSANRGINHIISNLRVADCSVMPTLNCGHTQMVAYAIGEKCAEMIGEEWEGVEA